jgi:opacity protein-like surface antigen
VKSRLLLLFVALVLCTLAPAAEHSENATQTTPALSNVPEEVGISVTPLASFHTNADIGYGMNATLSHYFTRRFGISADGEYLKSNMYDLHEYAFRAGPTIRFAKIGRIQPFARGLAGYARVKATYTPDQLPFKGPAGSYPYDDSFSFLIGAGVDVALAGPFSARVAGDFLDDLGTHNDKTRLLRLGAGIVYHFGGLGR